MAVATASRNSRARTQTATLFELACQSVEVLGRQPDGTWLFKIDYPFGLGWDNQQ